MQGILLLLFVSSHKTKELIKGHFEHKNKTRTQKHLFCVLPLPVTVTQENLAPCSPALQHTQPHLHRSQFLSAFFPWLVEWLGNQFLLSPHFPGTKEKCVSHWI